MDVKEVLLPLFCCLSPFVALMTLGLILSTKARIRLASKTLTDLRSGTYESIKEPSVHHRVKVILIAQLILVFLIFVEVSALTIYYWYSSASMNTHVFVLILSLIVIEFFVSVVLYYLRRRITKGLI